MGYVYLCGYDSLSSDSILADSNVVGVFNIADIDVPNDIKKGNIGWVLRAKSLKRYGTMSNNILKFLPGITLKDVNPEVCFIDFSTRAVLNFSQSLPTNVKDVKGWVNEVIKDILTPSSLSEKSYLIGNTMELGEVIEDISEISKLSITIYNENIDVSKYDLSIDINDDTVKELLYYILNAMYFGSFVDNNYGRGVESNSYVRLYWSDWDFKVYEVDKTTSKLVPMILHGGLLMEVHICNKSVGYPEHANYCVLDENTIIPVLKDSFKKVYTPYTEAKRWNYVLSNSSSTRYSKTVLFRLNRPQLISLVDVVFNTPKDEIYLPCGSGKYADEIREFCAEKNKSLGVSLTSIENLLKAVILTKNTFRYTNFLKQHNQHSQFINLFKPINKYSFEIKRFLVDHNIVPIHMYSPIVKETVAVKSSNTKKNTNTKQGKDRPTSFMYKGNLQAFIDNFAIKRYMSLTMTLSDDGMSIMYYSGKTMYVASIEELVFKEKKIGYYIKQYTDNRSTKTSGSLFSNVSLSCNIFYSLESAKSLLRSLNGAVVSGNPFSSILEKSDGYLDCGLKGIYFTKYGCILKIKDVSCYVSFLSGSVKIYNDLFAEDQKEKNKSDILLALKRNFVRKLLSIHYNNIYTVYKMSSSVGSNIALSSISTGREYVGKFTDFKEIVKISKNFKESVFRVIIRDSIDETETEECTIRNGSILKIGDTSISDMLKSVS